MIEDISMKHNKWDMILYVNGFLLVWALLLLGSVCLDSSGKITGRLAVGNILFLFVNIPLAVWSLYLKKKGRFSKQYGVPVAVLSVLNLAVGIAAWLFVVALLQKP